MPIALQPSKTNIVQNEPLGAFVQGIGSYINPLLSWITFTSIVILFSIMRTLILPLLAALVPYGHVVASPTGLEQPAAPGLEFLYTSFVNCSNPIYRTEGPRGLRTTMSVLIPSASRRCPRKKGGRRNHKGPSKPLHEVPCFLGRCTCLARPSPVPYRRLPLASNLSPVPS